MATESRLTLGVLLDHLVEEVGNPDLVGPATQFEGDLDGRPDVVGVHMAVPQAFASHHHDRPADGTPAFLERLDELVAKIEEVHHLVAQFAHVYLTFDMAMGGGLELFH